MQKIHNFSAIVAKIGARNYFTWWKVNGHVVHSNAHQVNVIQSRVVSVFDQWCISKRKVPSTAEEERAGRVRGITVTHQTVRKDIPNEWSKLRHQRQRPIP